jgi:nitroreductase
MFAARLVVMEPDNADRLQHVIETRRSCRTPFDPERRVGARELAHIIDAARWAPTAHNMQNFQLVVVEDRRILDELGRIRAPVSPQFIAENYRQLAWSPEELAERGTGLLATTFPPWWWTPDPALAPVDAARMLGEIIAGAPMLIVVVFDPRQRAPASEGDALGMISLGCVLENMWLAAHAVHLDTQIVSALSGTVVEPEVKRILAIPEPWRIAYALRLGHTVSPPTGPRVRRPPEKFVHQDRFGAGAR